ncbi:MAG: glycosyltransferase family 4 protein [Nostocaceae cyanobacterium]|nr:glycosyltransferase family 4 protein [Nostocaceae cyanobacterium]
MHLVLVISSLSCGGAERSMILLAEGFMKQGYKVSVVTIAGIETDFYQLPDGAHRLALNVAKKSPSLIHSLFNNFYRLRVLKQAICSLEPDIVISFLDINNILTLIALINTNFTIFVSEQNNPQMHAIGRFWKILRRLSYPLATKVVSSSQGVDDYFDWLSKTKRAVIYNPLTAVNDNQTQIDLIKSIDFSKKWIVAMGRLTYQKGFDILLTAFHKIANKYPDWQLLILGEGELRSDLENEIKNLDLTERVMLPGRIDNPFPLLRLSKLFVLSSRFEGFGNVLIEAMACGLPVISTDCPSGPKEIIREGIDGILVPNEDVSSLAIAIDCLISDEAKRQNLAAHAPEGAERFSLEKTIKIWENLFDEVKRN